jgi:hypothetical protein
MPNGEKVTEWFPKLDSEDIVKSLNRFYDDPANLKLPVRIALHITAMKVSGKTEADIQKELTGYRSVLK